MGVAMDVHDDPLLLWKRGRNTGMARNAQRREYVSGHFSSNKLLNNITLRTKQKVVLRITELH